MKKRSGLIVLLIMTVLMAVFIGQNLQSQQSYDRLHNPLVQGWMFGKDNSFAGERTWGTTGTADTLVVTNVDTTCIVLLTPKTATGTLRYDIRSAGDTIFVTSTGSETGGTDKYSYLIVRNGYGATD